MDCYLQLLYVGQIWKFYFLFIWYKLSTFCGKVHVCQWLAKGLSPGTPVSSTNKTDRHNITEILLKVALNTISGRWCNFGHCTWKSCQKLLLFFTGFPFFQFFIMLIFICEIHLLSMPIFLYKTEKNDGTDSCK